MFCHQLFFSIHRILKTLAFMKSKEFVVSSLKLWMRLQEHMMWDSHFFQCKKKKHFPSCRVHSACNDYFDFLPSKAQLENCLRYSFIPHKGYKQNMDRNLNYEKILIHLQIENTEGKVGNTIARYCLFINLTNLVCVVC